MCGGSEFILKTPKGLEKSMKKEFKKYHLKSYISVELDCYRVTVFDKNDNQNEQ